MWFLCAWLSLIHFFHNNFWLRIAPAVLLPVSITPPWCINFHSEFLLLIIPKAPDYKRGFRACPKPAELLKHVPAYQYQLLRCCLRRMQAEIQFTLGSRKDMKVVSKGEGVNDQVPPATQTSSSSSPFPWRDDWEQLLFDTSCFCMNFTAHMKI